MVSNLYRVKREQQPTTGVRKTFNTGTVYLEAMVDLKARVLPDNSVADGQGGVCDSPYLWSGLKITNGHQAEDFAEYCTV